MTAPVAILFDLDGTLIDSSSDLTAAANAMLETVGRPAVTLEQVESWIGHGLEPLVHRCLTGSMDDRATDGLFNEAIQVFRTAYLDTGFRQTRCTEGAIQLLEALRPAGFVSGIVTNKDSKPTHAVLHHLGLTRMFETIVCGDTLPVKKPDSKPIRYALELCGTLSGWMIGDSDTDATASAAAGIGFIGIRGGYGHRGSSEGFSSPPALTIESLLELLDAEGSPIEMLGQPDAFSG